LPQKTGLGIVAPDGTLVAFRGPDIVNFSAARDVLPPADGAVISYAPHVPTGSATFQL
jgi:hypothetical protein